MERYPTLGPTPDINALINNRCTIELEELQVFPILKNSLPVNPEVCRIPYKVA